MKTIPKKSSELIVPSSALDKTVKVIAIEYLDDKPFSVRTRVVTDWTKNPRGHRRPEDKKTSSHCNDYNFEFHRSGQSLYWHRSGSGGTWKHFYVSCFCEPNPPPAKLWLAPGVKAIAYVEGTHCRKTRDVSDAELLEMGYLRIAEPLELDSAYGKSRNPFDVSDGNTECHYCEYCNDRIPDNGGGRLCEHITWCDECEAHVYETAEGHVSIDGGEPVNHEVEDIAAWLAGEDVELGEHYIVKLRINGDQVEASNGYEMPIATVKAGIELARKYRESGLTSNTGTRFGAYYVTRISKFSVKIGCTTIPWDEVDRIEKLIDAMGGPAQ